MKPSSFRLWRKRVQGRKTKHEKLRVFEKGRFKCSRQKQITHNKISKRKTNQIENELKTILKSKDITMTIDAKHLCLCSKDI